MGEIRLAWLWLLLAVVGGALPAQAQPAAGRGTDGAAITIEELWARGESALEAGRLEAALGDFEAALARDARRARTWNYLGGVHFARGDLLRALENFQRALELDPNDARACNNLGTVHERLGELARAEERYLQATRIDPAYPAPLRNLGVLYAQRLGRPSNARRAWRRFLELEPDGPRAEEVRRELELLPPEPTPAASVPPGAAAPGDAGAR